MAPILGIWASSKAVSADTGAMFPLQVITVGAAGASSVTFTNIPSTYSHLQIRYISRTTRSAATNDSLKLQLNGDTGSNYAYHWMQGTGSAVQASAASSQTFMLIVNAQTGAGAGSNMFGVGIIDLLDYANTNKYKTMRAMSGLDVNGSGGGVDIDSSLWMNTNAVTSIKLFPDVGSLTQYSSFALYGIKGA